MVYLPLRDAADGFAIIGALVTTGCALFIFHASAGHVRSAVLRFVLALAVVLLPVAQLEIADSGVNSPWYLLFALFWAVLWRPGTHAGMAGAAAVGFLTAASTTMSVVFAPLLLARVIALPRLREHAVTAGWAAGCLLQVPYVVSNLGSAQSRAAHPASPGQVLAFYGHEVVLPALGWHLAPTAWLHACQRTPDGVIRVPTGASFSGAKTAIPCASLRRLCRAARSRGAGGPGGACPERAADPPGGRSGWRAAARAPETLPTQGWRSASRTARSRRSGPAGRSHTFRDQAR